MSIKLSILLDFLADYQPRINFDDDSVSFSDVCICYPEISSFKDDTLYVCLDGLIPMAVNLENCYMVLNEKSSCIAKTNLIRVSYEISDLAFYEKIHEYFRRYFDWQARLDQTLIKGESLQTMIDIGQEFLPNEMILLDGQSNFLAGSGNIEEDDEIYYEIVKNGRVDPKRAMEIITSVKYDKKTRFAEDEYYYLSDDVFGYPEIFWNYKHNGFVRASLFSKFSRSPKTKGYVDLFCDFILKLKEALNREQMQKSYFQMSDYPYQLLIEGRDIDLAAKMIGCPLDGEFVVVAIENDWDLERIGREMDYVVFQFHAVLASARPFAWEEKNYLLISYDGENRDRKEFWDYQENGIRFVLGKLNSTCGVSQKIRSLRQLKHACIQASKALTISKREYLKNQTDDELQTDRIQRYRNMGIYHVIETFFEKYPPEAYFPPALIDMWSYDFTHQTQYCEILRRYLINDRKISIVAQEMYMHRNNIVYHLNRIKEKFGIDYDTKCGKAYLIFCVFALEYLDLDIVRVCEKDK